MAANRFSIDRRAWIMPVLSFGAGAAVSLGVGFLLTRTEIPAMAVVDEVALHLPDRPSPASGTDSPRGVEVTDWSSSARILIRGNIMEMEDHAGSLAAATVPAVAALTGLLPSDVEIEPAAAAQPFSGDPNVRWFNARPARPARTIWMTVTGYSPDERSCGDSADGLTATLHSVTTNAMKLVAADPTVLPYGSMISVPGYDAESIVPVLDCGGAIKGDKLDLLFPTHEEALQWGRQRVLVTVWEYADGLPAENPRKVR